MEKKIIYLIIKMKFPLKSSEMRKMFYYNSPVNGYAKYFIAAKYKKHDKIKKVENKKHIHKK